MTCSAIAVTVSVEARLYLFGVEKAKNEGLALVWPPKAMIKTSEALIKTPKVTSGIRLTAGRLTSSGTSLKMLTFTSMLDDEQAKGIRRGAQS